MAIERAPDIEQFLREANDAYRRGDASFVKSSTSRHESALLIGSDAREVAHGYDEIVGMLTHELDARSSDSPRLQFDSVEAYRDGDVGWANVLGRYELGEGASLPARGTAVLHREDGEWRMLTWCFSFAVPNEEIRADSPLVRAMAAASG